MTRNPVQRCLLPGCPSYHTENAWACTLLPIGDSNCKYYVYKSKFFVTPEPLWNPHGWHMSQWQHICIITKKIQKDCCTNYASPALQKCWNKPDTSLFIVLVWKNVALVCTTAPWLLTTYSKLFQSSKRYYSKSFQGLHEITACSVVPLCHQINPSIFGTENLASVKMPQMDTIGPTLFQCNCIPMQS